MPSPTPQDVEAARRHSSEVAIVARRTAGALVLVVGLIGLGIGTFRYRHLNDLTAIAFAIGAALLALGVIAVIAVPMLELGQAFNAKLVARVGWVPGFGLVLTGITHFTDWKFYRDDARWLTVHKRPTMVGVHDEGYALVVLGVLLIAAALLAAHAARRAAEAQA
ncbi:MAG: hypothetical protein ACTHOG_11640 [Marmoricola sp.]